MAMWDVMIYGSLIVIVILTVHSIEAGIKRIESKLNRHQLYLDLILERLEIDVPSRLPERIKAIALDPQRRIEAIKLYREETGATLKDSVSVIDAYIASHSRL